MIKEVLGMTLMLTQYYCILYLHIHEQCPVFISC
jgi:hypothetical protein